MAQVRKITFEGRNFTAQREDIYCRCWDQWSGTNYHTYKKGWVVRDENGEVRFHSDRPGTAHTGSEQVPFQTFAELVETLEYREKLRRERPSVALD